MRLRGVSSIISLIFSAVLFFGVTGSALAQYKVHINGYSIDVKDKEPSVPMELDTQDGEARFQKWIVQFNGPINNVDKMQLVEAGCHIGDYLPDFAFIVSMDRNTRAKVENFPFVNGVVRFKPAYKIRQTLKDDSGAVKVRKGEKIKLLIKIDSKESQSLVLSKVQEKKGAVLYVHGDILRIEINQEDIAEFSRLEEVLSIEEAGELKLFNDTSKWTIQSYVQNSTSIWDKGLHGEGQIVGIGDTGLDFDMPWFRDSFWSIGPYHRKVVGYNIDLIGGPLQPNPDYRDWSGHGTHVAGIIAGDQSPFGLTTANGMAPKAKLYITDFSPTDERSGAIQRIYPPSNLSDLFAPAYAAGARLHNNSWGYVYDNTYNATSRSADEYMWANRDFLAVFANGNEGRGVSTLRSPATAKNVVSVGASFNGSQAEDVGDFSSNGPSVDGRIKPTVMAPGVGIVSAKSDGYLNSDNNDTIAMSGTSMAAPTVAGAVALIRQYYMGGYYPGGAANAINGFTPSAALVKATLINCAQNMTGFTADTRPSYFGIQIAPVPPIPSPVQGWGRINLANTLTFTGDTRTLEVRDNNSGLETGQSHTETYLVTSDQALKVTLAWTDYPGAVGANPAIVNDLDLIITAPDGTTTYLGNTFSGGKSVAGGNADRLNVEEQVLIDTPAAGPYAITVSAYNVPYGPQPYALVTTAAFVTSKGILRLDKHRYAAPGAVQIYLADRDLNTDSGTIDQVQVSVRSSSEPVGELVTLVESGPNTGIFIGTVTLRLGTAVLADGYLDVMGGDTITATYIDAGITVTADAVIDIIPPVISGTAVGTFNDTSASISWATNEPGNSVINYGETIALGASSILPSLTNTHTVQLTGLKENQTYYFETVSADEAGNLGRDNNGGTYYSFTTAKLPPAFTVSSSTGSESCIDTIVISGTATDPSGVKSVTVAPASGPTQACTLRTSDGYYECTVPLSSGLNSFTVTATDMLDTAATQNISVTRLSLPDLVGTGLTISPTNLVSGQAVTIYVKFKNQGQCPVTNYSSTGAYISTSIFLSTDNEITTSDKFHLNDTHYYGLAPGEERIQGYATSTPAVNSGIYYYGMIVDRYNRIAETDEANNSFLGPKVYIGTDTTPPTGSLLINNGATATGDTGVTLTLSATDGESGVTEMQFSNDSADGPWSVAEAYAVTKSWTLSAGDGPKQVFVKFRDFVGNWSMAYPSNTITYYSAPGIDTIALSGGIVNRSYQETLRASGGLAPYTWSVAAGSLPPSVTLNAAGELGGTPTTAGSTSVTFRVTDSLNRTVDKELELSVSDIEQQWLRTSSTIYSIGRGVVFDGDGNAYVVGTGRRDGINDDILLEKVDPDGATVWSSFLNSGPASAIGIARSDNNGVVVLGSEIDTSTGATGYQLIKYGMDGGIQWIRPLDGGAKYTALSIDGTGSINVAGYLNNGTADQVLVRKLDSAGNSVWTYTGNSSSAQRVNKITTDGAGNVYVAATATGTSGGDLLTMKLNAAGGFVWQETFHDADDTSSGIAVDAAGNVYVTGRSFTTVNRVVTVKYGASGGQQWSKVYERFVYSDRPESMVLGGDGNLYIAGRTYYLDPANSDGLILKYGSNGDILWSKGVEAQPGNLDYGYAIAVDSKDNLITSGFTAAGNVHYMTTQKFIRTDLAITTTSLSPGTTGSAYNQQLAGMHGLAPYSWSATDLPDGLTVSSSGVISGTPTTVGSNTVTVHATDTANITATKQLTIDIYAPLGISATTLPDGNVGTAYNQAMTATGGKTPYTWAIASGSLPAGLSLDVTTGVISGTPTTNGTGSFTAQVYDANGITASKGFSIVINGGPLTISTESLPDAYISIPFSQQIIATGGTTPYTWSLDKNNSLPAGLTFSIGGLISGTPTTAGAKTFTVQIKDGDNTKVSKSLTVTVYALPSITTASLPGGTPGTAYVQTVAATGGKAPLSWSITSGSLPAGLTLNSTTGAITGTPTTAGASSFTIQMSDDNSVTASKSLSINVSVAP